jgi:imidazolonepropionase
LVVDMMREAQPYVEYVDIACDPIGFTVEECERMGAEAAALGFRLRVHADQTGLSEGSELAARLGASSADHLDYISDAGIRAMAESGTVGVLLPGVTFHMMEMVPKLEAGHLTPAAKPHWPELVRRMIEGGMRLALSADYNPGSSPTQSMQMVMQLAARLYRLSYTEIWHMSTINAAHALDRGEDRGSLEVGKRADILIWRLPEYGMIINRFGVNQVDTVVKDGQVVVEKGIPSYS